MGLVLNKTRFYLDFERFVFVIQCRMRAAFDRVKKRLLLASTNLLLINSSDGPATKEGVCNIQETQDGNRHVTVVKVETEPVYNDLDPPSSAPSSEEENTYLDIDIGKETQEEEEDCFNYCTEKIALPYQQNESSFIETRPSLTPDEILLLYARIDKSKKTKNQRTTGETEANQSQADKGMDESFDAPKTHRKDQSFVCKIRDFHPKKVNNDLQLANKTVVDVSLNEFFIEHSRIRCKENNTTYVLESRPLPALPRAHEESSPDRDEENDSLKHIYATLPMKKF